MEARFEDHFKPAFAAAGGVEKNPKPLNYQYLLEWSRVVKRDGFTS